LLTAREPQDLGALQVDVAQILTECGFTVATEKRISLVRGEVNIDAYGQEQVDLRTYTILCECKHWWTRVPKNVIHGFRTVVSDSGRISDTSYPLGFKPSPRATWLKNYSLPVITSRLAERQERLTNILREKLSSAPKPKLAVIGGKDSKRGA
jgi:hypothetical protein